MKFYLNLVTDFKKRKKNSYNCRKGELFFSHRRRRIAATHICAFTDETEARVFCLFTFYLVIIEFNDLANEQNSDSHHNSFKNTKKN
jgi:hypothetical protein